MNISLDRAVEFLESEGYEIESNPNTKISEDLYYALADEFRADKSKKVASKEAGIEQKREQERLRREREKEREKRERLKKLEEEKRKAKEGEDVERKEEPEAENEEEHQEEEENKLRGIKEVGRIDLSKVTPKRKSKKEKKKKKEAARTKKEVQKKKKAVTEEKKPKKEEAREEEITPEEEKVEHIKTEYQKLEGLNFTGKKIDLEQFKKKKSNKKDNKKRKRKRITKSDSSGKSNNRRKGRRKKSRVHHEEPTEEEIQKQIKETLEKLQGKSTKSRASRHRREKREEHRKRTEEESEQIEQESKTLKVTEFVTASELATMMNTPVNDVIAACMSLGMMVTMNQRLDAETLTVVADEFGYEVEFVSADLDELVTEDIGDDDPEKMVKRPPIVTVMGHVDHGKTSLLDYVRKENVIAGESGGITQHIGAYSVELKNGQKITFLDTPGHEAFTAMRARGAQVTDIAIIVIAADDDVMPQTKEAISHAQAAGVPIVFAINKIDLPTADPDKIKQKLATMDLLVEDWGGKIQSEDISAKKGDGIDELLEKVLLEAEMLELKADPTHIASGTVVEAYLDKGRGYVSTVLVESGTLKMTDYVLAGTCSGKIKAMQDERGNNVDEAGPSTPVSILGLDGAPQAGDKFYVMLDEREARDIASKRAQLQREQDVRTQRHITLDEIGRRIALGDFQELNIILKGDVDGSVEALSDSFLELSTEEIQVNIIHKGVGAITESDVLLASASEAVIIGFNVRPAGNARQVADKEEIDIRTYSVIYDAIDDIRDAMEGMLSPELKEEVTGNAEIRETFKISKVGTIAGCMVTSGKIFRKSQVRLIRDGVVIYTGELESLKRFKDDVKEVSKGYECGLQIKNYNDIKEGDVVEAFKEVEVKKKL